MQIFATFDHSIHLEIAIARIEKLGIDKIFAVPLDNGPEESVFFDSIHRSDGKSLLSLGMILAVFFSVIGASRGFKLEWGPIFWGLIGAGVGLILGFSIELYRNRKKINHKSLIKGKKSEVIIIIECEENQCREVEKILWEQLAIGLAKV
ncbi:hypothetical protein [Bacillus sp. B1-b2]|uniref:hypothetical protein n=1 Tax=Bacillus sp. B1-b2 TaxID=2653201 RepID=UPI0012628FA9|nr:hypothetical protein [Bacillus sp. B1-b2]KAB7672238.1 hypothetical protein F9279_04820 [Bacillus sp. B1-b2]